MCVKQSCRYSPIHTTHVYFVFFCNPNYHATFHSSLATDVGRTPIVNYQSMMICSVVKLVSESSEKPQWSNLLLIIACHETS